MSWTTAKRHKIEAANDLQDLVSNFMKQSYQHHRPTEPEQAEPVFHIRSCSSSQNIRHSVFPFTICLCSIFSEACFLTFICSPLRSFEKT